MLDMEQRVILQERVKNFFCKKLKLFTITCKRLIKVFVYQIVANFILYQKKTLIYLYLNR
jgi:hypothetical protein